MESIGDFIQVATPTSTSNPINNPGRGEKSDCSICREEGDGFHFGAEACRACAAFFRRSVSLGKKYICRQDGKCEITANIRCMCRACRFTKCLEVGMNPAGVQQKRDTIGKRDIKQEDDPHFNLAAILARNIKEDSPHKPMFATGFPGVTPNLENMPILAKMRQNYTKMDNARLVIHRRDGQSLFGQKSPKCVNHKESAEVIKREVLLVADWISWCFDEFVQLSVDQKRILFVNFFVSFNMLESSYLCHINNRNDVIILPSGDYIDSVNLETFLADDDDEMKTLPTDEVAKLFKNSFDMHRRCLITPMVKEKVDVIEFFVLCAMIFWDFGIEGQSEECMEVGQQIRDKVMTEFLFYLKFVKKMEEPGMRFGRLFGLIPSLQRLVRRFQEDVNITHIFNLYSTPDNFYEIVSGKFA